MKKILCLIFLCLMVSTNCFAASNFFQTVTTAKKRSGGTDYTQDANCQGAWYMNGTTTETDRSGNSADLTDNNTVGSSTTVPSGYSGKSRDFVAANDESLSMADGGSTDISGADQKISFGGWLKMDAVSGFVFPISKYIFGSKQYWILLTNNAGNITITCSLSNDGSAETSASNDGYSVGNWYHVMCVYDDVNIKLYVNGSSVDSTAYSSGIYNGTAKFVIGEDDGGSDEYDGLIDEVIVLDRDLSSTEVSEIYNNGISGNKGEND